jgi:hypothetical protein
MNKAFQRKGAKSNAHVGRKFEEATQEFFLNKGLSLQKNISVDIGINGKKSHKFDLGNINKKILVECKSHTWTEGDNIPSAKITTWDQAMFFFFVAPSGYRKIFFVLKDFSFKKQETLAASYIRTKSHLIPNDVEIWGFDDKQKTANRLR